MRRSIAWAGCLAAVASACVGGPPAVSDADCERFRVAFAPDAAVEMSRRVEPLRALAGRFPDQRLAEFARAYAAAEEGFDAATDERAAFDVGLTLVVALHDLADRPPVNRPLADAVAETCDDAPTGILRAGPDAGVPEPDATTGLDRDGRVDQFVAALAEAHDRTDGDGCQVLREGLEVAAEVEVAPHLAAGARSGELGCVFVDPSGPVLLVVVAVDGDVAGRLRPTVTSPGQVVSLDDVFGMVSARGVAAFDARSDGWLIALTPGSPDPREALARLEDSLS